jgi:hypothetical protein
METNDRKDIQVLFASVYPSQVSQVSPHISIQNNAPIISV